MVSALTVCACDDAQLNDADARPLDVTGELSGDTGAAPALPEVAEIFTNRCSPCHIDRPSAGLLLASGPELRGRLMEASTQQPALRRIEAGAPDESYLWLKLNGSHLAADGTGAQMPFQRDPLPTDERQTIRRWIEGGAR